MTTRTFKQLGIAFGSQPANITAKIDNVVVYQGPVVTLDELMPDLPNIDYVVTNELFSWTTDVTFTGPQVIEVSTDDASTVLLAEIQGNYTAIPGAGNVAISSGVTGFVILQSSQFGNTYINDTLQTVAHTSETNGMWWWRLPSGSTFVENVTINPGLE